MASTRRVGWGWLLAAAAVVLVVGLLAVTSHGACYDSAVPGGSTCSSEPILGVPGTVLAIVGAVVFSVIAVTRAFRR